jgi:hypothetical protein
VRLQTESENTKLLKIQQREREVEAQYLSEKRNMEETLAKLALEQEKFMSRQLQTTEEFERQKEQIFANDRKKESYNKQKEDLELRNAQRREEIQLKEERLRGKKLHLEELRLTIRKYMVYEEFLREVRNLSDDFGPVDLDDFSVMSILERFRTMERKKVELAEVHRKIGQEKETRTKAIQDVRKTRETLNYEFGLRIKELKEKIDSLNEQNIQLESELEGQLNENGERQREFGQVIFSIRGLYLSIVGEEKQGQGRSIVEMLAAIREERKKLKEYLDLFQHKIEDGRKVDKKDNPS